MQILNMLSLIHLQFSLLKFSKIFVIYCYLFGQFQTV